LESYVLDTPPVGLAGVIATLRFIIGPRHALITDDTAEPLGQVLEVIERAA